MAGYIGSQTPVVSNGSQRKYTFTATAAQTVFTGMDIPNPQQIQVFQNGVRLVITTDYTVSSGTTVTLVNAASAGDSLVVILFADYQLLDTDALTFTGGTTIEGDLTVDTNTLYVDSTNNRVGVGTATPSTALLDIFTGSTTADGLKINRFATGAYYSTLRQDSHGLAIHVGDGSTISERVAITPNGITFNGDTAAANALDDYEEGTWTPVSVGTSVGITSTYSRYTKIGNYVIANVETTIAANSDSNQVRISLPFTVGSSTADGGFIRYTNSNLTRPYIIANPGNTDLVVYNSTGSGLAFSALSGKRFDFTVIYKVN
jgi:hypothetical protein